MVLVVNILAVGVLVPTRLVGVRMGVGRPRSEALMVVVVVVPVVVGSGHRFATRYTPPSRTCI